jgi:hypothetical protein
MCPEVSSVRVLVRLAAAAALGLGAGDARALELASAHSQILSTHLNGSAPAPKPEALGFTGSSIALFSVAPGFWPIAGGGFPSLDGGDCRYGGDAGDDGDVDPGKCSLIESVDPCDVLDVAEIARALELPPLLPGSAQVCTAAAGH